jgi:hypothetical protein
MVAITYHRVTNIIKQHTTDEKSRLLPPSCSSSSRAHWGHMVLTEDVVYKEVEAEAMQDGPHAEPGSAVSQVDCSPDPERARPGGSPLRLGYRTVALVGKFRALTTIAHYAFLWKSMRMGKHWGLLRHVHHINVKGTLSRLDSKARQESQKEFDARLENANVPKWAQGDRTLHKEAMWKRRMALRKHPLVTEQLRRWCDLTELPCRYDSYSQLMMRLYKVLIQPYNQLDALACASEDWHRDVGDPRLLDDGTFGLERTAFMTAIFEVADHWTLGVSPEEYYKFLKLLLHAVARGGALRPIDEIPFTDMASLVRQPTASEVRAAREEERAREAALRARRPKIKVHMTAKQLLVSRDHFVSPLARGWCDWSAVVADPSSNGNAKDIIPSPRAAFRSDRHQDVPKMPGSVAWSSPRAKPRAISGAHHAYQRGHLRTITR